MTQQRNPQRGITRGEDARTDEAALRRGHVMQDTGNDEVTIVGHLCVCNLISFWISLTGCPKMM